MDSPGLHQVKSNQLLMPKWIMDLCQSNRPGVLDRRNAKQDDFTKILEGTNQLSSRCTSKMSSAEILHWYLLLKSSTEILHWNPPLKSSAEILRWNPPQISFTEILKRPPPETNLTSNLEHQCSSRCLVIKNQYYNQWNLPKIMK